MTGKYLLPSSFFGPLGLGVPVCFLFDRQKLGTFLRKPVGPEDQDQAGVGVAREPDLQGRGCPVPPSKRANMGNEMGKCCAPERSGGMALLKQDKEHQPESTPAEKKARWVSTVRKGQRKGSDRWSAAEKVASGGASSPATIDPASLLREVRPSAALIRLQLRAPEPRRQGLGAATGDEAAALSDKIDSWRRASAGSLPRAQTRILELSDQASESSTKDASTLGTGTPSSKPEPLDSRMLIELWEETERIELDAGTYPSCRSPGPDDAVFPGTAHMELCVKCRSPTRSLQPWCATCVAAGYVVSSDHTHHHSVSIIKRRQQQREIASEIAALHDQQVQGSKKMPQTRYEQILNEKRQELERLDASIQLTRRRLLEL